MWLRIQWDRLRKMRRESRTEVAAKSMYNPMYLCPAVHRSREQMPMSIYSYHAEHAATASVDGVTAERFPAKKHSYAREHKVPIHGEWDDALAPSCEGYCCSNMHPT
ncbi:unnamed protein product [Pylaiella littoralis]